MDQARRRAERDAQTDASAEAQRLAAGLRSGELSEVALIVAAHLGDSASQSVLGTHPPGGELAARFEEVIRAGVRVGPGRVTRLEDPAHLEALARDCVEFLAGAEGRQEVCEALAAMAANDYPLAATRLAALEEARWEGSAWVELLGALERAQAVHVAPTRRRRVDALRRALRGCAEGRVGERSPYPWLAGRVSARLLGRSLAPPPPQAELPPAEPGPRGIRIDYSGLAACAAFPPAWRTALWDDLERVLAGETDALLPVEGPRGGWCQLPLVPPGLLARLGVRRTPAVAHLLLRDDFEPSLEIVAVARYPWLRVEKASASCVETYSYVFAQSGAEALPDHDISQCSYLRPPHNALPFHRGVSLAQLRGAVESLVTALSEPTRYPEPEARDPRETKHAAVLPELRARSAALLAQRSDPRDGQLVTGRCPRCSADGDLRVIASPRLVVCYRCYFDWW